MTDEKPSLIIPEDSYNKIMHYVRGIDKEISGFFEVAWDKTEGAFVIGQVYLLNQEVTGTATEMSEEAVAGFTHEMIKAGVDQLPRGWWHSHVNMGVFWSNTDTTTQKQLRNETYFISLVANKAGELKAKLCCYYPFDFDIDDLEIEVIKPEAVIPAEIMAEIAQKVKVKTYTPVASNYVPGQYSSNYTNHYASQGLGYDPFKTAQWLSKDKLEALDRIQRDDLVRIWDIGSKSYYYKDYTSGKTWVDHWDVVTSAEYANAKLLDRDNSLVDSAGNPLFTQDGMDSEARRQEEQAEINRIIDEEIKEDERKKLIKKSKQC